MYKLEEIRQVHLEMTEVCQAACPMCPRYTTDGQVNPHLRLQELTLDDCKKIFPPSLLKQLSNITMCGTHGDPAAAKDTLAVFKYFREHNPWLQLILVTNGGLRNKEWWTELASVIGNRGHAVFSVDGLRDTNHIYRRNVNWDIVENNMRAFIAAGGNAKWDFLIFEHNQHQVEEVKQFSKELGFTDISFKRSSRFSLTIENTKQEVSVPSRKGTVVTIKKPDTQYQNPEEQKIDNIIKIYESSENYYKTVPIKCKVQEMAMIYITAEGLFLPCCWLHSPMFQSHQLDTTENPIWKIINESGGRQQLDARNGLENVFNSGILENIVKSWEPGNGRLITCAETCGISYNPAHAERI